MPEKKKYKGSTDSIRAAVKRYDARLAHLRIRVTQEEKEEIQTAAAASGLSVNMFCKQAILARVQQERTEASYPDETDAS